MGSSFDDFYNELPEDIRQRVEAGVKEELEKIEEYRKWHEDNKDVLENIKTITEDKAKTVKYNF